MKPTIAARVRISLLASVALVSGASPAFSQTAAATEPDGVDDIVVTARRFEETLQEVPLSIAASSGEQLERRSIETLEDLGQSTPNFQFSEQPNGGRLGGVAFIRGIGQRDANSAYDPAVGIYVDGVYMGRSYGSNLDLLDIDRVEVLRGPQGTLFGKNTSGGAINIVTHRPDPTAGAVGGWVQLTLGSRDRVDVGGGLNIPLAPDVAALRVSGSINRQDGYGRRLDGQEMADTNRESIRARLLVQPTPNFSILLSGDYLHFDERNASYKLIDTNPAIGPLTALNNLINPDYDDRWVSQRDYFFNATGPNSARGWMGGASARLSLELGAVTLSSITAYREMDVHNDADTDGAPITIVDKIETLRQSQFSQELQAAGAFPGDRFNWIIGAYYFDEDIDNPTTFPLLPALFGNSQSFTRTYAVENRSLAVFGQGVLRLNDRLGVTAGLRVTRDEKDVTVTRLPFPTGPQTFAISDRFNSTSVSPRLSLDYRWSPNVMTYVSVAQGAKNGGFNGQTSRVTDFDSFDDESVWTYEAGLRSEFWNGRGRFNLTGFYSRFSNLQIQINGAATINGVPVPFNVITNIPRATIHGGEAEFTIAPAGGLTFTAGLGLTSGEYTSLPTDPEFVASRVISTDTEFSHMPKATLTLGADYRTSLSPDLDLSLHADLSHRSRIFYNTENTINALQPAYSLINARITLEARNGFSLSLYATNLGDEAYIIGAFDDVAKPNPGLGYAFVTQGPPREFGATARFRF